MDELLDFVPGGRLTVAALALLAVPGVRRQFRPVAKVAVRASLAVTDSMKEMVAEVREQTSDLVAEVRSEREQEADDLISPTGMVDDSTTEKRSGRKTPEVPATV